VNRKEGQFTGQGGLRIFWQAWSPEGNPKGTILVAHGYGEHSGRYGNLVDEVVPRGFAVYALDLRGHGRSGGQRGHVRRFAEFVADLHAFRVRVEEDQRGKPLMLLGHSMGGLIAVHYVLAHGQGLAGAVLSSPALGLHNGPSRILVWLGRALSLVAPRTSFKGNVDPQFLSRDPSVGRAYAADPLVHSRASARFFTEFSQAMRIAHQWGAQIRLPLLIVQAGDDRLVDAAAVEEFAKSVAPEFKEFHLYPGFYHELFNETERETVFADLERWLEARVDGIA
jgi:alpha-beta hydrolase superfamily lysophospholipase